MKRDAKCESREDARLFSSAWQLPVQAALEETDPTLAFLLFIRPPKEDNHLSYIIYEKNALVKTTKPQSFELSKKKILGKITEMETQKYFQKSKKIPWPFVFAVL